MIPTHLGRSILLASLCSVICVNVVSISLFQEHQGWVIGYLWKWEELNSQKKRDTIYAKRKVPLALSYALRKFWLVSRYVSVEVSEVIFVALTVIPQAPMYPPAIGMRFTFAAYATLVHHSHMQEFDIDSSVSNARAKHAGLYAVPGIVGGRNIHSC